MTNLQGKETFIGGGEESYGYLVGELVRDKDAIISSAFIAEMTAYYKDKGSSLFDALINTYLQYGFYKEKLISITMKGKTGAEDIKAMMEKFRTNPPATLGGSKVITLKDYERRDETDLNSNNTTKTIGACQNRMCCNLLLGRWQHYFCTPVGHRTEDQILLQC